MILLLAEPNLHGILILYELLSEYLSRQQRYAINRGYDMMIHNKHTGLMKRKGIYL
jgi:hypothetical protein